MQWVCAACMAMPWSADCTAGSTAGLSASGAPVSGCSSSAGWAALSSAGAAYLPQRSTAAPSAPQMGQSAFMPSAVQAASQTHTTSCCCSCCALLAAASSPSANTATGSRLNASVSASRIANSRFFMYLCPFLLSCRRFLVLYSSIPFGENSGDTAGAVHFGVRTIGAHTKDTIDGREKQAVFSLFWKIDGAGCIRNGICRIFCIKSVAKRRKMWYDMKLLNSGAVS